MNEPLTADPNVRGPAAAPEGGLCPACASRSAERVEVISVADQHAAYFPFEPMLYDRLAAETNNARGIYRAVRCGECGLVYASPLVAPTAAWYEIAYTALQVRPEHRWEFDVVCAALSQSDRVFEIGCGQGLFLRMCRDRQVLATGIDFSREAVQACRRQGLSAEVCAIGTHLRPSEPATAIASFQVLEHLDDPGDLFRQALEASAEDAVLWVSVPSNRSVSRVLSLAEPFDSPPHHLSRWTEPALAAIGARHGWRLERVTFEPFGWRGALWSVASHFVIYDTLRRRGALRHPAAEKSLRLSLYPVAAVRLGLDRKRHLMTGISMLARYRREPNRFSNP